MKYFTVSDHFIRLIDKSDNIELANIIRNSLLEFNAAKPGTVYYDKTTDHLYELFRKEGSCYFVAITAGKIAGGCGIYPTAGLDTDTCELVKFYLSREARGKGIGRILLNKCMEAAVQLSYHKVYIETMPELKVAIPMYEKAGFKMLPGPLGNSGHSGCDIWMIKQL